MSPTERSLQALLTQLQFEMAEAGAELARAGSLSATAQAQHLTQQQRCEGVAVQWRAGVEQTRINPALLQLLHRQLSSEADVQRVLDRRRLEARKDEAQAHAALSAVLQRTRAMEKLLLAERRSLRQRQQAREINGMDDLWLQHFMRAPA